MLGQSVSHSCCQAPAPAPDENAQRCCAADVAATATAPPKPASDATTCACGHDQRQFTVVQAAASDSNSEYSSARPAASTELPNGVSQPGLLTAHTLQARAQSPPLYLIDCAYLI